MGITGDLVMKSNDLNIKQRIIAVGIYTLLFLALCRYFSGSWEFLVDSDSNYNLLFISGALLLVFGTYIAEPYFTAPVDVITNSIAVVLALLSIREPNLFFGYWYLFYSSVVLGLLSIVIIFTSQFHKYEKLQKAFFEIITKIGQSKFVFSVIYLLTIVSYFRNEPIEFVFLLTFWIIFVSQFVVESLVKCLAKILAYVFYDRGHKEIIGEAIGCENPFLYKIEIDFFKHHARDTKKGELVYLSLDDSKGAVGIIINEKQLLNKKWVTVYLLEKDNAPLKIDLRKQEFISGSKTIFSRDNAVYSFDLESIEDNESKKLIEENYLFKYRHNFIGYIADGSDINKVRFHSLLDSTSSKYKLLKEGTVIKTEIHSDDVLYQIIDGKTHEEELEKHNIYGYLTGIAQKLGKYNIATHELEVVKWLPSIYAPVFFDETKSTTKNKLAVGHLPETELEIVLRDAESLVTHNTAVLGILGIGKSCLSFELIKKTVENCGVKVICIDITNEYLEDLKDYGCNPEKIDDIALISTLATNYSAINKDLKRGGNHADFQKILVDVFTKFLDGNERVMVVNPEDYEVSRQTNDVKPKKIGPGPNDWEDQAPMSDLTVTEKTRILAEAILEVCKSKGKTKKARCLVVFEEAHSLVPEWNSSANKGDENASNGTAKVIMQGRKYGLGSFVITQRTANISKSILNQCNTIFALRVFDDTGKQFLENYIGSDYSNTLPTLEDRHAIAVGKALNLKQPVIIRLNDKSAIISNENSPA